MSHRTHPARRVLALAVAASALAAVPAEAAKDDLELVSRSSSGVPGTDSSGGVSLSDDGRYAAFVSRADNVSAEDADAYQNVFVRDRVTGTTTLVSRESGAAGDPALGNSEDAAISPDGRYVAFSSQADDLSIEDDNDVLNIYVRDLVTHTTTWVSKSSAGDPAEADAYSAAISAGGRYVLFLSQANDLSTEDADATIDAFVHDRQTGETTLVSRADGPAGAASDEHSYTASMSHSGRRIAFTSQGDNLSAEDDDDSFQTYVRDLDAGTTRLVSRATGPTGVAGDDAAYNDAISPDGRYVAFASSSSNLDPADPSLDEDVFLRDLQAETTTLVSRADGPGGASANDHAGTPDVSADGRYVSFASAATNLTGADLGGVNNIHVRDMVTHTTTVVSRADGPDGTPARTNNGAFTADITPDGRYVGFTSDADTLGEGAADTFNAYVRDVLGAPAPPVQQPPVLEQPAPKPQQPAPAPPAAGAPGRLTAKMGPARATIVRGARMLDVLSPISAKASGTVDVELRAAGRTFRFKADVDSAGARIRFRKRIPAAQARLGTGILTLRYPGDADTRPQVVRLRAAAGPAALAVTRPTYADGRLKASGTVGSRARGSVRVQLEYEHAGTVRTLAFGAKVADGRWSLDEALPENIRGEIAARTGTVHSYTLFTGYLPARVRGEMRSFEVLGSR